MATYAPLIRKEHERIIWQRPARPVFNQIRGLSPWPVAHTLWRGKRLKVGQAAIAEESSQERPGQVLAVYPGGVQVATGQGSVYLQQLQPEGKRMLRCEEFIRGYQVKAGEMMGE